MKISKLKKQLKSESKNFVPDIKTDLFKTLGIEVNRGKKPYFNFKPYLVIISTVFILLVGLYFFLNQKSNDFSNTIITIDINPTVEIEVNEKNNVVNIRPLNLDAALLLEENEDLINQDVYLTLDVIIEMASNAGYLTDNVEINVVNERQKVEDSLGAKIKSHYQNHNNVTVSEATKDIKEKAKTYKVSVGKMKLIEELIKINPELTIDKAKKLSIKELNEQIRSYNEEKINESKQRYNKVIKDFKDVRDHALNDYFNAYEDASRSLTDLKQLIDTGKLSQFLEKIEVFLATYNIDYEISELDQEEAYDILEDLSELLEEQNEFITELIAEQYDKQLDIIKDVIKKGPHNNFTFDFTFIAEISRHYYNDDEKEVVSLINEMNLLIDNYRYFSDKKDIIKEIDEIMEEINELIDDDDISEEFKAGKFMKNIKIKYDNFKRMSHK